MKKAALRFASCMICMGLAAALAGCGAQETQPVPSSSEQAEEPAVSASVVPSEELQSEPQPVWRMEDSSLFDGLSLTEGQEPVILDVNESLLLVAVSRDFPQDSPYWHEGGGVSSYTDGVYLLDVQTGEILETVSFPDGLTYCGSGVLLEDGFALQQIHHDEEFEGRMGYEIVRYFTDGTEPDVLQDFLYTPAVSQMFRVREYVAYTTDGIISGDNTYEMQGFDVIGYCGYELGKGILRGNGRELAYYTEQDGMGEDVGTVWIPITVGYQYGTVRTVSLETGYSIADFCFLSDDSFLFSRFVLQEDGTRGESSLVLLNSVGHTLAETACPVHFNTLLPLSDRQAFARGADGYFYLVQWSDTGISIEKTAFETDYKLLYCVDESNCLVWDYRDDSLALLTCQ